MYIGLDDWPMWTIKYRPWVEQRFSPQVLAKFTADVEPEWLTWLDEEQAAIDGNYQESVTLFENEIRTSYFGLRVFHASRLSSIAPITQHGLRAWSARDLRRLAHDLYPDIPRPFLLRAIEACNPDHRGGHVYSFASLHHALGEPDEDHGGQLPSFCVHGSEFLVAVGEELGYRVIDPPGEARAYYFACDLPWAILAMDIVTSLAKTMLLNVLVRNYLEGNYSMYGPYSCITTQHDIHPEHIVLYADVEGLAGRNDLVPADIRWQKFPRR